MSEIPMMRHAWVAMVRAGAKLWRNNIGEAWYGRPSILVIPGNVAWAKAQLHVGDRILKNAHPVRYGLVPGSPDLIGYLPVIIKAEDVGKTIAIFLGAEAKDTNGSLQDNQRDFIATACGDGAICFEFRSADEGVKKIGEAKRSIPSGVAQRSPGAQDAPAEALHG